MTVKTVRLRIQEGNQVSPLGEHPLVRTVMVGKSRTMDRTESWFDTPDLMLRRRGIFLQARRLGGKWVGSVHFSSGGEVRSKEWVCGASDGPPDWSELKRQLPEAWQGGIKINSLELLFAIECLEERWRLEFPDGGGMTLLELHGVMRCGSVRRSFHELVLENLAESPTRFFHMALALGRHFGAVLEPLSPSTRGFVRRDVGLLEVASWNKSGCRSTDQAIEAFSTSGAALLELMLALLAPLMYGINEDVVVAGERLGWVVARLSTLLGLFQFLLPDKLRQEMEGELTWLAGELQELDEWSGLLQHTLRPMVVHFQAYPVVSTALERAEKRQKAAIKQVLTAVESARFTQLFLGFAGFLMGEEGVRASLQETDPMQLGRMSEGADGVVRVRLRQLHKGVCEQGRNHWSLQEIPPVPLLLGISRIHAMTTLFADVLTDNKMQQYQDVVATLYGQLRVMIRLRNEHRLWSRLVTEKEATATHALFAGWQGAKLELSFGTLHRAWEAFLAFPVPKLHKEGVASKTHHG